MMNDMNTKISDLKKIAEAFVAERDWQQFHNPKNLSMDIAIEAAELMELFLWTNTDTSASFSEPHRQKVSDELADIFFAILCFANATHIDLVAAFEHKLAEIKAKYPIEKAKGIAKKYTDL